jgi:GT2 family glycosyltransferase
MGRSPEWSDRSFSGPTSIAVDRNMAASDAPRVVVAILNWNNLADTIDCIESVLASEYPSLTAWLVDNGSEPDPSAEIARRYPGVRILRQPCNLGFGGGHNVALRQAIADGAAYVLLLNNDAVLCPDAITWLTAALEEHPRIGIATPRVFFYDDPSKVYWDGGFIDWKTGDTPHDSSRLVERSGVMESEWLDGCALFVRLSAVLEFGFFDERYFLYYEDAEWTVRAARSGWTNAVVVAAAARHKVSKSTGGFSGPLASFYYLRNRYLFLSTHGRRKRKGIGLVAYGVRVYADYRARRDLPKSRRAILEGYWSVIRCHWGQYVPTRYPGLLALVDSIGLCLTRIGSVVKRGLFWLHAGRSRDSLVA